MTQVLRPPATLTTAPAEAGRGRRRTAYVRTIGLYVVTLWAAVTLTFLLPGSFRETPLPRSTTPTAAPTSTTPRSVTGSPPTTGSTGR